MNEDNLVQATAETTLSPSGQQHSELIPVAKRIDVLRVGGYVVISIDGADILRLDAESAKELGCALIAQGMSKLHEK